VALTSEHPDDAEEDEQPQQKGDADENDVAESTAGLGTSEAEPHLIGRAHPALARAPDLGAVAVHRLARGDRDTAPLARSHLVLWHFPLAQFE
jgi:hypothetical protein